MAHEQLPVQLACRVLHVAEPGYYAWRERPPSNRLVKHAWLTEAIVGIHATSRGTYGSHRVHTELDLGLSIHVSHSTVELLMQRAGLHGLPGNRRQGSLAWIRPQEFRESHGWVRTVRGGGLMMPRRTLLFEGFHPVDVALYDAGAPGGASPEGPRQSGW